MTEQEQRIAIAEACPQAIIRTFGETWMYAVHVVGERAWLPCACNDPLHDLNAMNEAEKALSDKHDGDQFSRYCLHLNRIACRLPCGNTRSCGYTICATAPQRAEAFLRTLNLWKD